MGFPRPEPLFNPLIAPVDQPLTPAEILAGPFGLIAFVPLVPLLRLLARRWPRGALIGCGLIWAAATAGPLAAAILLAGCLLASTWVVGLGALRRSGRLSAGR